MEAGRRTSIIGRSLLAICIAIAAVSILYAVMRGGDSPSAASPSAAENADVSVAELQDTVRDDPDNGGAWLALGRRQFDKDAYADAAASFKHATQVLPDNAVAWSALGEALVMASEHDPMPADALAAFNKAVTLDPGDPRARYFLAVDKDLSGDHKGAIDDWFALMKDTPPGAPWAGDLRRTIEQVGKINDIDVADRLAAVAPAKPHPDMPAGSIAAAGIPGPSPQQMQDAARLTPDQQDKMVQGMVSRLEGRLADDPSNVAGWIMLMRSRMTLNQPAKAKQALKDATAANPGDAARLKREAGVLGVPPV